MTGSAGDGFEPKSTLEYAGKAALQGAAIGTVMSGVQNALQHHSHGALGIFTRTGSTIGFFGASLRVSEEDEVTEAMRSGDGRDLCGDGGVRGEHPETERLLEHPETERLLERRRGRMRGWFPRRREGCVNRSLLILDAR